MMLTPLSAVEQLNRCQAKIGHWNQSVNAMITLDAAGALGTAGLRTTIGNRLRKAGAVIVKKCSHHAFTFDVRSSTTRAVTANTYAGAFSKLQHPQKITTTRS